ncbi:Inositol polyphosphate 5-phosphatase K [Trichinella murrelli]|uniref:Inositol polyphosphate 5-phosphatase K n=1 Tax=Trichinella murrelli TaxID=144512 RepID=A0A0V0TIM0_9BILA|nr:Inositol polyphosphate 5-phosphatase K [Trichinella murrelli]
MSSLQKDEFSTLNLLFSMRIMTWNVNKVNFRPGILSPAEFHMSPGEVEKLDIIVIGFVFWFGDLNFRVDGLTKEEVKRHLDNKNYSELLKYDQLNECKSENAALKEFNEAQIEFAPTYKFKPGEKNERNFSRMPSYCDRILWRTADHCCESSCHVPNCKIKKYTSVEHVFCSDHKAVLADFKIQYPLSVSNPEIYFCNADGSEFNKCWYVNENSICIFFEPQNYKAGILDWIGLYEVGFSSDLDVVAWKYVLSKWVNRKSEKGVYQNVLFLGKFLVKAGKYQLGYYSQSSRCLRALSKSFQIVHRDKKKKD